MEAEKKGLGKTLFQRLTELHGEKITAMLTVQYRMHELIMAWSSHELYDSKVRFMVNWNVPISLYHNFED